MKVIDLLNKIANGEEVPKKIKVGISEFYKNSKYTINNDYDYENDDGTYLTDYLGEFDYITNYLNKEIEIIEEEQDIEELKLKDGKIVGTWENGSNYCYTLSAPQTVLCNKINELIKEVNKQKNNEEVL